MRVGIVMMVGGEPFTYTYRVAYCHSRVWPRLLELAQEGGWRPAGTTPCPAWAHLWERRGFESPDYHCDPYGKRVTDVDARSLASGLTHLLDTRSADIPTDVGRVMPVLHRDEMDELERRMANSDINQPYLRALIAFFRSGEFSFFLEGAHEASVGSPSR